MFSVKKAVLAIMMLAVFLATATAGMAVTLTGSWEYLKTDEAGITGFKLKDANGVVVKDILKTARTVSWTIDEPKACQPYYLTTYLSDGGTVVESPPSNVAMYCPEAKVIKGVGTFNITLGQ